MDHNRPQQNRPTVRRAALVALAAGASALLLTACGSGADGSAGHAGTHASKAPAASPAAPSPAPGGRNAADTAFAKGMVPHHRQAVEMADLAPSRAGSAEVRELAAEIRKAQDPEIKTLSGWLASWGEQVPAEGAADHSGHGTGSGPGMTGMMTAEEMDKLAGSSGKAFDTAFMELMIKHHEGAVEMARTELKDGAFPAAKEMAEAIIGSQSAEISRMKSLLGRG
ncbi:DUF305 domain-containing protein [Streptomyces sp. NPDC012888]|uniref:DUF305 domain-containing protein n=1 Tax=Streptomyces sp. NPDC012888 TaxID=3364855 RepID=UPI00367C1CB7